MLSRQLMMPPPLTFSACPLISEASSDAKNATARPMSSGVCGLGIGCLAFTESMKISYGSVSAKFRIASLNAHSDFLPHRSPQSSGADGIYRDVVPSHLLGKHVCPLNRRRL